VAADLGALLEDDDPALLGTRVGELELLEPDGSAKAGRSGADDADVDVVLSSVGRRRRELALVRRAQAGERRGEEAPGGELRPAGDDDRQARRRGHRQGKRTTEGGEHGPRLQV
jgi:hypothetical protein